MKRKLRTTATLLIACLALAGGAVAGELADLHRQLVGSAIVPVAPGGGPGAALGSDGREESPVGEAHGAVNDDAVPGVPGVRPLAPLPQRSPLPAIERVGYEAQRCRGFCEAFTVIFSADGSFEYVGEANVERLGEHSGTVDRYALEQLLRFVDAIDYAALRDTYASSYADVQTSYTMVDYGDGELKVVQNQGGEAPVTVWAMGRLIRDLLEDAVWD